MGVGSAPVHRDFRPPLRDPGNRNAKRAVRCGSKAIAAHGGEILKFIGDGLLAIFPIEHPSVAGVAARNALAAAIQAARRRAGLERSVTRGRAAARDRRSASHRTAIYGNIGAANRLDFTVIGPAVNLVSRIEAVAKTLNQPIVVSADFARAYGRRCIRSAVMRFGGSRHATICLHRFCPPFAYRVDG